MSGHSKWSQIKRQKGVVDRQRGKIFSKLANLLTAAARTGGDPDMNPRLRIAIDQARAENMPKENIDRAIKRGTGELDGATLEELRFEAYGPGGVGIVIEAATDNRLRTNAAIKAVLHKLGGKLATAGAVAFQFKEQGVLTLPVVHQALSREEIELAIIEADAADYQDQGDVFQISTDPKDISHVKERLEKAGLTIAESKLSWEPTQTLAIDDPAIAKQIVRLMSALEDLDDIIAVTANFVVSDDIMTNLSS